MKVLTQSRSPDKRRRGQEERKGIKKRMMTENEIGKVVVDAAIAIHKALGSGL